MKRFFVLRGAISNIMGSGIAGVLVAYEFIKTGIKCCVIDRRMFTPGSSSAGTTLLQNEGE